MANWLFTRFVILRLSQSFRPSDILRKIIRGMSNLVSEYDWLQDYMENFHFYSIPRLTVALIDSVLLILNRRRQIPVLVSYHMTFNKTKRQSFNKCTRTFESETSLFTHDQIDVAQSRSRFFWGVPFFARYKDEVQRNHAPLNNIVSVKLLLSTGYSPLGCLPFIFMPKTFTSDFFVYILPPNFWWRRGGDLLRVLKYFPLIELPMIYIYIYIRIFKLAKKYNINLTRWLLLWKNTLWSY